MNKIDLAKIKNDFWIKNWAGTWSVLTCYYLGKQYSKRIHDYLGVNLKHSIIVIKKGFSTCYFSKKELDKLGNKLADKVIADKKLISTWSKKIKAVTRDIDKIMYELSGRLLSFDEYSIFLNKFIEFGASNFAVKKVVDYLPDNLVVKYLPLLSEARLSSEHVYADTEKFMEQLAELIGKKYGYKPELILCLSDNEFASLLKTEKIVSSKKELAGRFKMSALFFNQGQDSLLLEKEALGLEASLIAKTQPVLKGMIAYSGRVQGVARIILNPAKQNNFKRGEILVTSMTRPEYLSLINLAAAFITDAGGRLCHAAITAREIKKPCIVGLESATKVIKDGDLIEVDADSGLVKILKR